MADRLNPDYDEASAHDIVELKRSAASVNEMLCALISGLAAGEKIDDDWSRFAFKILSEHNWRLGFTFNEERPPIGWHDEPRS